MRLLGRILLVILILLVIAIGGAYIVVRESLPLLSGTVRVAGIGAPVEITRDREGVPHIVAGSQVDAYFGLGYAHAQDRLWQMEMSRRIAAGRLSEVVGTQTLDIDRFLRTLGVHHHAERTYPNLTPAARNVLDAYSAGVNAYLRGNGGPLPPEFLILRHTPEPWQPADSLAWVKMMAFNLGGNMSRELQRARMAQILTPQQILEFLPAYPGDGPVEIPNYAALYRGLPLTQLSALTNSMRRKGTVPTIGSLPGNIPPRGNRCWPMTPTSGCQRLRCGTSPTSRRPD